MSYAEALALDRSRFVLLKVSLVLQNSSSEASFESVGFSYIHTWLSILLIP